jgi:hypothetical protein
MGGVGVGCLEDDFGRTDSVLMIDVSEAKHLCVLYLYYGASLLARYACFTTY